jgi:hypothetical protein
LWFIFEEEYIYFSGNDWLLDLALEEALLMMVGGFFTFFVTLHLGKIFASVEKVLCKNLLMSRHQVFTSKP